MLKLEKWVPKALNKIALGYDGHTIYLAYLKDQKKVIQMKNPCIFENSKSKFSNKLSD